MPVRRSIPSRRCIRTACAGLRYGLIEAPAPRQEYAPRCRAVVYGGDTLSAVPRRGAASQVSGSFGTPRMPCPATPRTDIMAHPTGLIATKGPRVHAAAGHRHQHQRAEEKAWFTGCQPPTGAPSPPSSTATTAAWPVFEGVHRHPGLPDATLRPVIPALLGAARHPARFRRPEAPLHGRCSSTIRRARRSGGRGRRRGQLTRPRSGIITCVQVTLKGKGPKGRRDASQACRLDLTRGSSPLLRAPIGETLASHVTIAITQVRLLPTLKHIYVLSKLSRAAPSGSHSTK